MEKGLSLRRMLLAVIAPLTISTLTACGGGGGSSAPAAISFSKTTGVFANVSGMAYSSGTQTGTTGTVGSFTYYPGNSVTFKVGDISVGQTTAAALLTPLHLFPGADAANPGVVNVMRFLMSVGTCDTVNLTIAIPPAVADAAKGRTIDLAKATDAELLNLVQTLTGNGSATLVDGAAATDFLSRLIYKHYGGTYRGSFTGSPTTLWEWTINTSDGTVTGVDLNGNKETHTGMLTSGVDYSGAASGGCQLTGNLNVFTGVLSGTWFLPRDPSVAGTFRGTRISP